GPERAAPQAGAPPRKAVLGEDPAVAVREAEEVDRGAVFFGFVDVGLLFHLGVDGHRRLSAALHAEAFGRRTEGAVSRNQKQGMNGLAALFDDRNAALPLFDT